MHAVLFDYALHIAKRASDGYPLCFRPNKKYVRFRLNQEKH